MTSNMNSLNRLNSYMNYTQNYCFIFLIKSIIRRINMLEILEKNASQVHALTGHGDFECSFMIFTDFLIKTRN